MTERQLRQVVLSTDNLDESIRFYTEVLGFPLKYRDGNHYAALDGGNLTIALATDLDHPIHGQVVVGVKTNDVDGDARLTDENGGDIARAAYDDTHERRAVVYDAHGNGIVFYSPLPGD